MTTNYKRIKQMTVEEMAEWLRNTTSCKNLCVFYSDNASCLDVYKDCTEGIKQWLLAEVENA